MVGRHVAVVYRLSLAAPAAARKLVPDGSVHGIVAHVQSSDGDQAARGLQQLLGKFQGRHLSCTQSTVVQYGYGGMAVYGTGTEHNSRAAASSYR